jgi:hypothetical protein
MKVRCDSCGKVSSPDCANACPFCLARHGDKSTAPKAPSSDAPGPESGDKGQLPTRNVALSLALLIAVLFLLGAMSAAVSGGMTGLTYVLFAAMVVAVGVWLERKTISYRRKK